MTDHVSVKTPSELMMERETQVAFGPVPRCLFGDALGEATWQMLGDEFLLRGEGDHYFHYRKGEGVRVERGQNIDLSEESLWLNGSVYSAIASMNGLLPIHASAVAHEGRVVAFTGPAGAGKSTLVAALGNAGLRMFCDDTLVLDLSQPDRILCLPGHKRLKLRADAVLMTAAISEEEVSATVGKVYARSAGGDVRYSLPLAQLVFLEEGPAAKITPISGANRFARLEDDHQTTQLFATAQAMGRVAAFEHRSRLARQIAMACFERPRDHRLFNEGIALVAEYVTNRRGD